MHAIVETLTALRGVLASKDLLPIAIIGRERLAAFPEVPTLSETVPGLTAVGWLGLFAPKGAPEAAVEQMSEALRAMLGNESIKARLGELGTPFKLLFSADLAAFIAEDQALWLPLAGQP